MTNSNHLIKGKPFGRWNGRKQNYKQSWATRDSQGWNMERPSSSCTRGTCMFHPNIELINNEVVEKESEIISIDDVLPYDLQECVLASLPLVDLCKSRCVCRKWNHIIRSEKFELKNKNALLQNPWYYMFTIIDGEQMGYLYDSGHGRWYNLQLPFVIGQACSISSSCGLSCFMDEEDGLEMYVCNPITGRYSILEKPTSPGLALYTALAFSVDRSNSKNTVIVIRALQDSEDFLRWVVAVHIYISETRTWLPPLMGRLDGWRPGNVAVICNGVLYFLANATRIGGNLQHTHGVISYKFNDQQRSIDQLIVDFSAIIYAPCPLTCGRLMNIQNKLVLVGGIARRDRIRGVGIWVLEEGSWEKITFMPLNIWQGFWRFDEVFVSSGSGDLIYVQLYGGIILAVFDMKSKEWNWSNMCPMKTKYDLQIFSGLCFEPNLKVSP